MLDLLLEVFGELIVEFFLQFLAGVIVDVGTRFLGEVFETERARNLVASAVYYSFLGALAGALSAAILPHPLVRPSKLHGISLLISPLLTGLAMSSIGSVLRRQDKEVARIESFGYGFAFAFGMALVRLILVKP